MQIYISDAAGSNRTLMELKHITSIYGRFDLASSNRTLMELKLGVAKSNQKN